MAGGRAEVAIVENVAGRDVEEALSAVVAALPLYEWRAKVVRARDDLGLPMARDRLFLVGLGAAARRRVTSRAKARERPRRTVAPGRSSSEPAPSVVHGASEGLEASATTAEGDIIAEFAEIDEVDGETFHSVAYDVVVLNAVVVADPEPAFAATEARRLYSSSAAGRRERADRRAMR